MDKLLVLCRCENCSYGSGRQECLRLATREDGFCDRCRNIGPRLIASEVRIATEFDLRGEAISWEVVHAFGS